jgi:DNA-binding transcriptional LysR family regulator
MSGQNWDDLRFVLAVVDEGSVNAAARRLKVNHATVIRRIAAFEMRSGTQIFDKTPRGYFVSADCDRVIDALRDVEQAVQVVSRMIEAVRNPLAGEVRVTSTDSICMALLPSLIAQISREAPQLSITLLSSNTHMDLGRTHADVTVRPTQKLPDDLVGEKVGELVFGVFRKAGPHVADDVPVWLVLSGALRGTVPGAWQARQIDQLRTGDAADSFLTLRELAAEGRGLAILPVFLGNEDARLAPAYDLMPVLSIDIWVASHFDLADVPRIALMRTLLRKGFAGLAPRINGQSPGVR